MIVDGSSLPLVGYKRHQRTFDVFISFRGGDTRRSFTSHLSSALYKKGVDVFVDDQLEKGDEISKALLDAIEGSKISLVVFSKDYALSRWCLDELVHILQCKKTMDQLVIPIFYNVDPSHVRWQKQSFAVAFEGHEESYKDNMEKVDKWRSALHEAANLSGHNSSKFNSDPELIDALVGDTVEKLHCRWYRPNPKPGLVGIESRMEEVLRLLDIREPDIRILGICGMGGIGKTTLVDAVFDRISGDFGGSYFFRNVRKTEEKGDLVERTDEALSVLLGEDLHIGTSMQRRFVVDRLRRKRVLVVLDDVNNQRQLETIFVGLDQFGIGSRVIITTRDKQVLNFFPEDKIKECSVKGLNNDEALQLFRQNAYGSREAYDELDERVVDYASGIPLALKVFARSLRGKDKHEWASALNKLRRVPNLEIRDSLKISYDALEDEEIKDIFLDIACFFEGQDKDEVVRLLDGCYVAVSQGISVLKDKALITVVRNKIEMHDLVQELGWDIVIQECKLEPGRRSRLWRPEDVHHVVRRNTYKSHLFVCLPGSNIPDWFTHWERGPSITFQWPTKVFGFCISVAFMDYSPELGLCIRGDFFDNGEADYSKKKPLLRLRTPALKRRTWSQSEVQHQHLGSDHIFLLYDIYRFHSFPQVKRKCDWKTVTITFRLLDAKDKPLESCRVEKCGYYVVPSPPLAASDSV